MNKNLFIGTFLALVVVVVAGLMYQTVPEETVAPLDPTPTPVTLSGTYVCLSHADTTGPQTEECAFGIQTDDGEYYAVNFGASAQAMEQFQSGVHIRAEGFVVIKEALSTNQWEQYTMKGVFTVTNVVEVTPPAGASAKINVQEVCQGALAYMTFSDAVAADAFVAECIEGKHPEVIEQYKASLQLDGAEI
jgi:hypothetical protein